MREIQYTVSPINGGRRHYVGRDDIQTLLSRLPEAIWHRLRAVHFNDRWLACRLGYVNHDRRTIAICALPQSVSLSRFMGQPRSMRRRAPEEFGAVRGSQWPELPIRRLLLYEVFLHELGHLQFAEPDGTAACQRIAGERRAQEFANLWRRYLWSRPFEHTDPVHNPPG